MRLRGAARPRCAMPRRASGWHSQRRTRRAWSPMRRPGHGMDALRHVISDKYVRAINSVRAIERLAETPNQRLVLVPMESAGRAASSRRSRSCVARLKALHPAGPPTARARPRRLRLKPTQGRRADLDPRRSRAADGRDRRSSRGPALDRSRRARHRLGAGSLRARLRDQGRRVPGAPSGPNRHDPDAQPPAEAARARQHAGCGLVGRMGAAWAGPPSARPLACVHLGNSDCAAWVSGEAKVGDAVQRDSVDGTTLVVSRVGR